MQRSYYDQHEPVNNKHLETGLNDTIIKERDRPVYYFTKTVRTDLNPDSSLPADDKYFKRENTSSPLIRTRPETLYSSIEKVRPDQPIIVASPLKRTLNYLAPPALPKVKQVVQEPIAPSKSAVAYLIPQLIDVVNMRGSVVATSFLIPSLMTRIDSYLIAEELNRAMGTSISLKYLVEAITTRQANHGYDYERLEFIGDSYLKLISTVAVYLEFPQYHEGLLTMRRTAILENKNLRRQAIKRKLYENHLSFIYTLTS